MLLPCDRLACRVEHGRIEPFWLGPNDEAWVGEALAAMADAAGHGSDAADDLVCPRLARVARRVGVPVRAALTLWTLERRRWNAEIDAPVSPPSLREVVFELAAKRSHDEALELAAARFRIHPEEITAALFADRRGRRVLVAPDAPVTALDTIVRYNLAVAQALIARAMEIEAFVRDDAARVAARAKQMGLVAWVERQGRGEAGQDAARISMSGPLSLFHDTTKYGRVLARFVPVLASAPSWSLRAHVVLGDRTGWLELDDAGPLGGLRAMPGDVEAVVVRRVVRAIRRGGWSWRVEDAEVLDVDGALAVFDFALVSGEARVFVDVMPFATPEHLARRIDLVRRVSRHVILCIDERFAPPERAPFVLPYRANVDAAALVSTAERITRDASSSAPPSPA